MADAKITITRTFEYKLRTNRAFIAACERELEHSRQIYNAALQERISAYREFKIGTVPRAVASGRYHSCRQYPLATARGTVPFS